jgi:hypothetical protein
VALKPGALADRVAGWLFEPAPVLPLVLARIAFGAVLFAAYLQSFPDVLALFGSSGLAGPQWPVLPGRVRPSPLAAWLDAQLGAPPDPLIWLCYVGLLLSSLAFAIGWRTRASGLVALALHVFFEATRLPWAFWGWAQHIQPLVLYVELSRAGRFASLDDWLRRRRSGEPAPPWSEWVAPAWPLRLLQVHTCTMYLVAGTNRVDDVGWLQGNAVWAAVTRAEFSRFIFDWRPLRPVLALMSWGALALEASAPFLLWLRRVGPWVAYGLVAMHLGLEALTLVGYWNFVMIASLSAFLPVSHLRAVAARLPGAPRGGLR